MKLRPFDMIALVKAVMIVSLSTCPLLTQGQPTSTSVENLTSVAAPTVGGALGFNLDIQNSWEYHYAQEAGATEVRISPGWSNLGTTNYTSGLSSALQWCSQYHLQPDIIAAFSPPWGYTSASIPNTGYTEYTVAQDCPVGSTTLYLNPSSTLSSVNAATNTFFVNRVGTSPNLQYQIAGVWWSYYGTLITSVNTTNNTITLAAKTTVDVPAGTTLIINQMEYAPCGSFSSSDTSNAAYCAYVQSLATSISGAGLMGRVEIWNEPTWPHDQWNQLYLFYDAGTSPVPNVNAMWAWADMLGTSSYAPPSGVTYVYGGPETDPNQSLFAPWALGLPYSGWAVPTTNMLSESFHTYGNNPEDHAWSPTAVATMVQNSHDKPPLNGSGGYITSALPGANWGSGFRWNHICMLIQQAYNSNLSNYSDTITETGASTDGMHKAINCIRQYMTFLADGVTRVDFFEMAGASAATANLGFADSSSQTPTQAYYAIQGLVAGDMAQFLSVAPLNYVPNSTSNLPVVPTYSGTYPLDTVSVVGRTASTDAQNSIYFVSWQRSMAAPGPANILAQATSGNVAITIESDPNALTTNILRATTSGGPYTNLTPSGIPDGQGTYNDKTVNDGTTYYYVAQEVNPAGVSGYSNEIQITPPTSGTVNGTNTPSIPAPVTNLWATVTSASVELIYSNTPTAQTTYIYRSNTSGGPYTNLTPNGYAVGQGPYYDASAAYNGTPTNYYYVVQESNAQGVSANSDEIEVTTRASGTGSATITINAPSPFPLWDAVPAPGAANVTVQLPASTANWGYTAASAWNLVTRALVTPVTLADTTNGGTVTASASYGVTDDPVCLNVMPAYFNVNFNGDTVGSAPATASFASGVAGLHPTVEQTNSNSTASVVSSLGGLTGKPLQLGLSGQASNYPSIQCESPSTAPIVTTSGMLTVEWDESVSSYAQGTYVGEVVLTHNIMGNGNNVLLTMNTTTTSATGGTIYFNGTGGQDYEPTWSLNTPTHFKLQVNVTNGTYSAWANGAQFATNRTLSGLTNLQGLNIRSGNGNGTWTAAIDNILIYPQANAELQLPVFGPPAP